MSSAKKLSAIQEAAENVSRVFSNVPKGAIESALLRRSTFEKTMDELNGGTAVELARRHLDDPVYRAAIGEPHTRDRVSGAMGLFNRPELGGIADGTVGAIAREHLEGIYSWQKELAGLDRGVLGQIARQQTELEEAIQGIVGQVSEPTTTFQEHVRGVNKQLQETMRSAVGLDLTSKRFAALAGVTDTFGIGDLHRQATESLLGSWHTVLDLPERYWAEPSSRRDFYREAEVDEGLIEATPETAIELGIGNGAIIGEIVERGHYVLGSTASGLLTLRTANLAGDIFDLVGRAETTLRKFVARKLKAAHGDKWFKQRAPGDIVTNARNNRRKALKNGENTAPLIDFVTLGELMQIIINGANWESVFEPVFRNRRRFQADIEIIGMARNPNAHYRPNDALRLAEVMIVWRRLQEFIDDDGQWMADANADE